ncbi:hypothetical protein AWB82_05928 [Caballeronia glebae]|uniref:Uncharacterized protein n=1 Tax=Caballeronia glebae TaxID=1777143 RepID=A0A158CZ05_9BURK|nr:hypothetical protein AWB82_05928 [Caballeronia glebae]
MQPRGYSEMDVHVCGVDKVSRYACCLCVATELTKAKPRGKVDDIQMSAALITKTDVWETARQQLHTAGLDDVESAILERNGQVSITRGPKLRRANDPIRTAPLG